MVSVDGAEIRLEEACGEVGATSVQFEHLDGAARLHVRLNLAGNPVDIGVGLRRAP